MCPAQLVGNDFERLGDASERADNTDHCVVDFGIVQQSVAAPLREERAVPVGHEVAASYTHCVQHNIQPTEMVLRTMSTAISL